MDSKTITIELENVQLNVGYYFTAAYESDEQELENMHLELIYTVSGDDITELLHHYDEKIREIIYNLLEN